MRVRFVVLLITSFFVVACSKGKSEKSVTPATEPTKEQPIASNVEKREQKPVTSDVGSDVGAPSDAGTVKTPEPLGRLCIKGPGTHSHIGKGSEATHSKGTKRARRLNAGLVLAIDEKEATVRGKTGATIEGLALHKKHRVSARFADGGSHHGFSFRFKSDQTETCAYYNGFYDNWRVRDVGRKGCGPCEAIKTD